MKPTNAHIAEMQDTYARYRYDHHDPSPEVVSAILDGLEAATTTQEHVLAMTEGIDKGLWYWSNHHEAFIAPPRKEWVDV